MFVRGRLARLRKMHDNNGDPARPHAVANRGNQAALQVVALQDHIPGAGFDLEGVSIEIRHLRSDFETSGTIIQSIDRSGRSVDGCHRPTVPGKPDGVASRTASEI
jgi:hypothetical protein